MFLAGIGFLVYLILSRRKLQEEEEIESFSNVFGEVFEEFKEERVSFWMFYLLYVLRRLGIVICFMFINSETLQLSIYFASALSVPSIQVSFYVLATRNFKVFIYNLYHVPNEMIIAAYGLVMLVQTLPESKMDIDTSTNICMNLITVCWVMNMASSIFVSAYGIFIKIRECIRKRRALSASRVYTIKTEPGSGMENKTIDIEYNIAVHPDA